MELWQQIKEIRALYKFTVRDMCDIFDSTESQYCHMRAHHIRPSNYQLIMLICLTCRPIEGV